MRRVVSYGGASGVPASQRLKHKLSMTAGMHLLYNDLKEEQQGFLAPVVEPQQERIIHRTSWATRNFSSTKSVAKGFVSRRSDAFSSVGGSVLEDTGKVEIRTKGGVPGLSVATKREDERELIGRSTGTDIALRDLRRKDVEGNPASNTEDHPVSSSNVGKAADATTSSTDSTITPACANLADGGDGTVNNTACSRAGESCSDIINDNKGSKLRFLGSEGTHAMEPSVSLSSVQVQEGWQIGTSTLAEVDADQKQLQDLESEVRVCELASVSTSSVQGVGEDSRALHRVNDVADVEEQVQVEDNDDIKLVEKTSIPRGYSWPNIIQGDLSIERNKSETVAAVKIQSCWKGWLQRSQYRLLKRAVARKNQERKEQEMCNAATVLQKSWRRAQNRLMLKHLRIEKIVRDRAATVIQAHVRGHSSRCELRKMSCAVLRIQNCWRQYRSVQEVLVVAAAIQQAEERRLHAAITLQAYARGFVVRQELVRMHKSATTIQRQWKAHKDICSRAAIKLQAYVRGFSVRLKYAMHKKAMVEERAAILIQACVRGHLVRCHLTILHTAALIIQLQWRRYSRSCRFEAAAPLVVHGAVSEREILTLSRADSHLQSGHGHVRVEKDVEMEFFNERALKNEEDEVLNSKEGLQPSPELSPLEKMVDITVVQQIDQREKTEEKAGEKGPDIALLSRRDDFGLRPLLNGELPAFPTGELPVGKVSQNEDWNDVSIDHLDECLDTCLASLKPLPVDLSASVISADQCFPKFVILEEGHPSQQKNSNDRSSGYLSVNGTESVKVVTPAKAEAKTTSHSAPRLQRASSRKGVKHEISKDVPSNSSNGYLNQTTLSSRDSLQPAHGSSAKLKRDSQTKVETHQVGETECGNKGQGKSRYTEDLKRNEERLQQFAQVFLLQRHIAYQQQRAQSAPPFPLPALAGSGSSQDSQVGQRDICTESGIPERDSDSVVLKVHHNAIQRQPRNTQNNLDRGNVYRTDTSSSPGQEPVSNHNGAVPFVKHHRQTPGTDVVVDMVLLLRKVEEVYGTSDVVIAESSSSCFPARSGDIEEGGPVVDRRKKSSTLGFTKSISMRQIGLPNVNAMLLVIIAMVVYTRTICQGVIFGHRQTHRKI